MTGVPIDSGPTGGRAFIAQERPAVDVRKPVLGPVRPADGESNEEVGRQADTRQFAMCMRDTPYENVTASPAADAASVDGESSRTGGSWS